MDSTYRQTIEDISAELATTALRRAGVVNPTPAQQRTTKRCTLKALIQEIAAVNPAFIDELHTELVAAAQPA